MSFYIISDIHSELSKSIPNLIFPTQNIALCGDIGNPFMDTYKKILDICSEHYQHVFVIAGNHEYYNYNRG